MNPDRGLVSFCRWAKVSDRAPIITLYRQHLPGRFQTVDFDQHVVQLAAAGGLESQATVSQQTEAQLGISQRVAGDQLADVSGFGALTTQEFETGRDIVKKVLHRNHRPLGTALPFTPHNSAVFHFHLGAH